MGASRIFKGSPLSSMFGKVINMALISRRDSGSTLAEFLVAFFILALVSSGMLMTYLRCVELAQRSEHFSQAVQAAQSLMETSRSIIVDRGPAANPADSSAVTAKLSDLADAANEYSFDMGFYPPTCYDLFDDGYISETCAAILLEGYNFSYSPTVDGFNFIAEPVFCNADYSRHYALDQNKVLTASACSSPVLTNSSFSVEGLGGRSFVRFEELDTNFYEIHVSVCWRDDTGRVHGEDSNLNGTLDMGEDKDGDGKVDSPAMLVSQVYVR